MAAEGMMRSALSAFGLKPEIAGPAVPVYLIVSDEPRRRALACALGPGTTVLDSLVALGDLVSRIPGLILIDRDAVSASELVEVGYRVARNDAAWHVGVLDSRVAGSFRSLSFGPLVATEDICADRVMSGALAGASVGMRTVLTLVATARHSLNNQLGIALTEIQLLRMDAADDEILRSCDVIAHQLRAMRDVVADSLSFASAARWL